MAKLTADYAHAKLAALTISMKHVPDWEVTIA